MKLLPVSDLHFEFHADHGETLVRELERDVDVLIVAGDLANADGLFDALELLAGAFPEVVYVPGNHDWYRGDRKLMADVRKRAADALSNVHWLDRDVVEIGGQRFVGTTLWFPDSHEARRWTINISDFSAIKDCDEWIWTEFEKDRAFLRDSIEPGDVVVTHHLPTRKSIVDRWVNDPLNCYFLGNVEDIVREAGARWWFHGHTHDSCDYKFGRTRVLCNPFGYPDAVNREFRGDLVVGV